LQQLGGRLATASAPFVGGVVVGHYDVGVFESETAAAVRLTTPGRSDPGFADGDLDHPRGQRFVEFARHL